MSLRWFVTADSPADEAAIAGGLRSDGCEVVATSDTVYVAGHFDAIACAGTVPAAVRSDVTVYIGRPMPAEGDHGGAAVVMAVGSIEEFRTLLSEHPWLSDPLGTP
jgi:hypothetical protein